jgi:hypothetical protein
VAELDAVALGKTVNKLTKHLRAFRSLLNDSLKLLFDRNCTVGSHRNPAKWRVVMLDSMRRAGSGNRLACSVLPLRPQHIADGRTCRNEPVVAGTILVCLLVCNELDIIGFS